MLLMGLLCVFLWGGPELSLLKAVMELQSWASLASPAPSEGSPDSCSWCLGFDSGPLGPGLALWVTSASPPHLGPQTQLAKGPCFFFASL